jgi:hypothetical protein
VGVKGSVAALSLIAVADPGGGSLQVSVDGLNTHSRVLLSANN